MFILDLSRTYNRPVAWKTQSDTPAAPLAIEFTAKFNRLKQDEIREIAASLVVAGGGDTSGLTEAQKSATPLTNRQIVDKILGGWDDIQDINRAPLPFSDANKEEILAIKGAETAFIDAWWTSLDVESEEKNSQVPPNTGQPAASENPSTALTPSQQPQLLV